MADTKLFLWLNGLHNDFFDFLMLQLSYNTWLFLSFIVLLMYLGFRVWNTKIFIGFFFCLLAFGVSDFTSSKIFKKNFKRLRPCHNQVLKDKVHLAGKKCWGGKYGFVSSHAANSFAITMFFWLLLRRYYKKMGVIFILPFLISYSRIYLAKHYPLDILGGAILGIIISYAFYSIFIRLIKNYSSVPQL